jgi:hypothetical protein
VQSTVEATHLPLFYNQLTALDNAVHEGFRFEPVKRPASLAQQNVVPLVAEEFSAAGSVFPILFSTGDRPVPMAVMGLNVGENCYVDPHSGTFAQPHYVPAYIRRYPWILARKPGGDGQLALCFDASSGVVRASGRGGYALFMDGKPSPALSKILAFCHAFEVAAARTERLIDHLLEYRLLKDCAINVHSEVIATPLSYQGFRIVDGARLLEMPEDHLQAMARDGSLQWIHDHLKSLDLVETVYRKGANHSSPQTGRRIRRSVTIANVA